MSEDKLHREISRGKRAKLLLEDQLLIEAFDILKSEYVTASMGTDPRDSQARDKYHIAFNQVDKVREHLGRVLARGSLAQKYLDDLK